MSTKHSFVFTPPAPCASDSAPSFTVTFVVVSMNGLAALTVPVRITAPSAVMTCVLSKVVGSPATTCTA